MTEVIPSKVGTLRHYQGELHDPIFSQLHWRVETPVQARRRSTRAFFHPPSFLKVTPACLETSTSLPPYSPPLRPVPSCPVLSGPLLSSR